MKKYLFSAILFLSASLIVNAQSFVATYNFAATTSLTGTTDPTPSPVLTGITCGTFVSVGTSTSNASAGRFSFSNWPIATLSGSTSATSYSAMGGTIDFTKYYEVQISPSAGFSVKMDSITFLTRRTSTGPRSYAVRCSADAYSSNLVATVPTNTLISALGASEFFYTADASTTSTYNSGSKIVTNGSLFMGFTNPITFRFYAWNAELISGNFGIDDVSFFGSVTVSTSIAKLSFDLNSNFNVYPIPSSDGFIFIENKNMIDLNKIEVIDVLGNLIYVSDSKSDTKVKLNLSEMPSGNYFVRMYSGNSVLTKKISVLK